MRRVLRNTIRKITRTTNLKPACLDPSPAATSINKQRVSSTQGVPADTFTPPENEQQHEEQQEQQPEKEKGPQEENSSLEAVPVTERELPTANLAEVVVMGTVVKDSNSETNPALMNTQAEKLENTALSQEQERVVPKPRFFKWDERHLKRSYQKATRNGVSYYGNPFSLPLWPKMVDQEDNTISPQAAFTKFK
jgi:hypothetical protein